MDFTYTVPYMEITYIRNYYILYQKSLYKAHISKVNIRVRKTYIRPLYKIGQLPMWNLVAVATICDRTIFCGSQFLSCDRSRVLNFCEP